MLIRYHPAFLLEKIKDPPVSKTVFEDYFECEKCEELHRQGETCDSVVEQNLGQNSDTSTMQKERTYMTDSEDEDQKGAQFDNTESMQRVVCS